MSKTRTFVRGALAFLFVLTMGLGAVGCNTTEGMGEDTEAAGDAIKDAARDAKD